MTRIRGLRLRPRTKRLLIVNAALALLALACLAVVLGLRGRLPAQRAAERFAGDSEFQFAQLSALMSTGDKLNPGAVYTFRRELEKQLSESSLETTERGRLYIDAWCSFGKSKAVGDHGSADVDIVAVGGEWFFFHPLRLKAGEWLYEDDVMDDRVVLDRELAWRLFGGDDLTGLTLDIGGRPFRIAGVVERDGDFASRAARGEGNVLYMSYTAWNAMSEDRATPIDCYELASAQPVEGFVRNFMKEKFPLGGGELVDNGSRFRLKGIWSVLGQFGTRSMQRGGLARPEWENAARCLEDWCALFLGLAALFAVCPVLSAAAAFLVGLVHLRGYLAKTVPALVSEAVDRSRVRRWEKTHPKQDE
ncbi:MAG: ABC transporter permease [Oscillospiraceae bacterium]|nr:ABC transporter permease [Oscillospiraceae bacterium]